MNSKLFLIIFFCPYSALCQNTLLEWKEKLRTAQHDTVRMSCYSKIADLQYTSDSMIYYIQKGLNISKKYPNHIVNAKLFNTMGRAFEVKGKRDTALYYIQKAYAIALRLKDDQQIKYTHFNSILLHKSPAEKISELLKMLKKYKFNISQPYDKTLLFTLYGVIADSYMRLDNIDKQGLYLQKSHIYISSLRDSIFYNMRYAKLLSTKAEICFNSNDVRCIKSVSENYKPFLKSMEKFIYGKDKHSVKQLMPIIYGCYSEILMYEKKYNESIYFIGKATSNISELDDNLTFTKHLSLGQNYVKLGRFKESIFHLQKAYEYYKDTEFTSTQSLILKLLAEANSNLGYYKKSYEYLNRATKIDNLYYSKQQQQLSLEVDKQFELAKKQEEVSAKELENKLNKERIKVEEKQKQFFIILMTLSLCLLVWSVWSYIKQKNLSINLDNYSKTLKKTNEAKDKIFGILGHDLRSPINELKVILMLFYSKDITPSKAKDLLKNLTIKIETIHGMLDNLLQWSLLEFKQQPLPSQSISLSNIVEKVIPQLNTIAQQKQITIITNLHSGQILASPGDLEIVIRNIVYNAIKFTPKGGTIQLKINKLDSTIEFICKDTGIGMELNKLKREKSDFQLPKTGTAGEMGSGLGLKISQELILRNNGKIQIESEINKGTEVNIIFPKFNLELSNEYSLIS